MSEGQWIYSFSHERLSALLASPPATVDASTRAEWLAAAELLARHASLRLVSREHWTLAASLAGLVDCWGAGGDEDPVRAAEHERLAVSLAKAVELTRESEDPSEGLAENLRDALKPEPAAILPFLVDAGLLVLSPPMARRLEEELRRVLKRSSHAEYREEARATLTRPLARAGKKGRWVFVYDDFWRDRWVPRATERDLEGWLAQAEAAAVAAQDPAASMESTKAVVVAGVAALQRAVDVYTWQGRDGEARAVRARLTTLERHANALVQRARQKITDEVDRAAASIEEGLRLAQQAPVADAAGAPRRLAEQAQGLESLGYAIAWSPGRDAFVATPPADSEGRTLEFSLSDFGPA